MFLHLYLPNPIAFSVGPLAVHWYGLFLALGIIAGYLLVSRLAPRTSITPERATALYLNTLIWGFVGARVWHVFMEWPFYREHLAAIPAVWSGGLAIHGALLAGVLTLIYYARRRREDFWKFADLFALPLILGQAIGRWGNYFNQELFGAPTSQSWGIPIEVANRPAEFLQYEFFHPAFLYESLWNAAVFAALLFVFRKLHTPPSPPSERGGSHRDGLVFWLYVSLYSLGRAGTELLRLDPMPMIFGMRLAFIGSLALVAAGGVMIFRVLRRAA